MAIALFRRSMPLLALAFSLFLAVPTISAAAPLIVIDPGHGGPYSNANANGLREENVNLAVSLELRRQLKERGYRVAMTRTTDRAVELGDIRTWNWSSRLNRWSYGADGHRGLYTGIPKDDLQARVKLANKMGADLFISVHHNGSVDRSARGTETYASPRDRLGRSLAPMVHRSILKKTGLRDRGSHTADFYVCRWSNMPAILVEGAFITSPRDARLLKKAWFRRRLAAGIAEGVHAWYKGNPITNTTRKVSTDTGYVASRAVSERQFPDGAETVVIGYGPRWRDVPGSSGRANVAA